LSAEPSLNLDQSGSAAGTGQASADLLPTLIVWFKERRQGLAASLAIHALLLVAAFLVFPTSQPTEAPPADSLPVEMITPAEFAAATTEAGPASPPAVPSVIVPPIQNPLPPPRQPRELVAPSEPLTHATRILSGRALDRVAEASLKTLQGDARIEQLCDIEAMEQIARAGSGHVPERAVAYATAETSMDGDTLVADGGAFLSKGHWYQLKYRCRLAPDRRKVISFDFATGEQFPDNDPALPADSDDD
jgi:hypothetical protein